MRFKAKNREVLISIFILSSILCLLSSLWSAFDVNYMFGARAFGMAGAYTACGDVDSILWNPAGLSQVSSFEASFMYLNPFGIDGLSQGYFSLAKKFSKMTFAFGGSQFLWENYYREEVKIFAFALSGNSVSAGLCLKFMEYNVDDISPDYSFLDRVGIDAGLKIPLGINSSFGISVTNLNRPGILKIEKVNPRAGFSFYVLDNFLLCLDLWSQNQKNSYAFGMEYEVVPGIFFRAGLNKISLNFGCGLSFKKFRFDWAFQKFDEIFYDNHRFSIVMKW